MDMLSSYRKKTYLCGSVLDDDATLQVTFELPELYGRETENLVKEKIDNLFNEVRQIIIAEADRREQLHQQWP